MLTPPTESPTDILPVYNWYPAALAKANASAEHLSSLLQRHIAEEKPSTTEALRDWINTRLVIAGLGISDALPAELDALAAEPEHASRMLAGMVSARARVGWSTRGHSAVDVNVYAHAVTGAAVGSESEAVGLMDGGNMENTDIGKWMARWLRVEDGLMDAISKQLNDSLPREDREGWSRERVVLLAEEHDRKHLW